jgi:hypothetical protein
MTSGTPNSVNELVQFIAQFVGERIGATSRPVHGAAIAEAVRGRYPDLVYHQLGLERLSDVIRIGEREGLLRRRKNVSHLEVEPGIGSPANLGDESDHDSDLRYVRPDVWTAIIFYQSKVAHFFDRTTAQVIDCDQTNTSKLEEMNRNERYVKLEMISSETQRVWMREFLRTAEIPNPQDAPVDSQRWWEDFPRWLQGINPELEPGWRVYRVQAIIAYVRQWAAQNNVPINAVLEGRRTHYGVAGRGELRRSLRASEATHVIQGEDERLRAAILKSITELSTEDLIRISIPLRSVLRHFVPR